MLAGSASWCRSPRSVVSSALPELDPQVRAQHTVLICRAGLEILLVRTLYDLCVGRAGYGVGRIQLADARGDFLPHGAEQQIDVPLLQNPRLLFEATAGDRGELQSEQGC